MNTYARPCIKLTRADVATIRAWQQGPGKGLAHSVQAKRLVQGVPGWWSNTAQVVHTTLYGVVREDSWPGVEPDWGRLAQWEEDLAAHQHQCACRQREKAALSAGVATPPHPL